MALKTETEQRQQSGKPICSSGYIGEGQAKRVRASQNETILDLVLVRQNGRLHAYANECPHSNGRLNAQSEKFLSRDGSKLMCSYHYAKFRIEDGLCLEGPCEGDSLTAFPVMEMGRDVFIKQAAGLEK